MQQWFSLGVGTLIGLVCGPLMAAVAFGLRRFVAYMDGTEHRSRPFKAWAILLAVAGAVIGSMLQSGYEDLTDCRAEGRNVGECLFLPAARE